MGLVIASGIRSESKRRSATGSQVVLIFASKNSGVGICDCIADLEPVRDSEGECGTAGGTGHSIDDIVPDEDRWITAWPENREARIAVGRRTPDLTEQAVGYGAARRLIGEENASRPTLRESHVLDRLIDIRSRGGAVAVKLNPNLTEGDGTVLNSNIPKFISAYPDNGVCRIGRANDEEAIEVDRHVMLLDRDDVASHRAGNDIVG